MAGLIRAGLLLVVGCTVAIGTYLGTLPAQQASALTQTQTKPSPTDDIESLRSEYAKVYATEEGAYSAVIETSPVHYENKTGAWEDIDDSLVKTAQGYRNAAGPLAVEFPDSVSSDKVITVADGKNDSLRLGLADSLGLSNPEVEDNRITYREVNPGVDLAFEVWGNTVKEYLILNRPPTLPDSAKTTSFRFPLELDGLTGEERPGGAVVFRDTKGAVVFEIPRLWMFDSSGDEFTDEPALSEDLELSLESQGDQQFMRVEVDLAWLQSPKRIYPVTIDPTVTTKEPTRDTFVQSNILNTPQNTATDLKSGTYDGGSTVARSLIKFNTATLQGTNIQDASLRLWNNHSWSCDPRPVEVHRVAEDWSATVTWPNRPSFGALLDSKYASYGRAGCASERINFDVTTTVRNFVNGSVNDYGFGVKAGNEDNTEQWKRFASAETGSPPRLVVTYNTQPNTPTNLRPLDAEETNLRPEFSATYRDPDPGDRGQVDFRIYRLGEQVAFGNGTTVDPGETSTWRPPLGTLKSGRTYFWEARSDDGSDQSAWVPDPRRTYTTVGGALPLNPTLPDDLLVAQSDTAGLEQFYPYESFDLGSAQGHAHLYSGNLVVKQHDITIPNVGLNTVISHTYNAQRSDSLFHTSGAGRGWSLSLADADTGTDVASPSLDVNAPVHLTASRAVVAAGSAIGAVLEFSDGDGTVHRFTRPGGPGTAWQSPPGVNLRIKEVPGGAFDPLGTEFWIIRPDGVVYAVEQVALTSALVDLTNTWHVTRVFDRNDNTLTFDYTDITEELAAGALEPLIGIRLESISHSRANEEIVALDYDRPTRNLTRITTLPCDGCDDERVFDFTITPDGRLTEVTRNSHSTDPDDRVTTSYSYYNEEDLLAPYKPLRTLTDGRGATTSFTYDDPGERPVLTRITDRELEDWSFDYSPVVPETEHRTTTMTTPRAAETSYEISGRTEISGSDPRIAGHNIERIEDPGTIQESGSTQRVIDTFDWEANRLRTRTDGAGNTTSFDYIDLGLADAITLPPKNEQRDNLHPDAPTRDIVIDLDYERPEATRFESAVAQLTSSTHDTAASTDRQRRREFGYDEDGNLIQITERSNRAGASNRVTTMTYYAPGLLETIDGPRSDVGDVSSFGDQTGTYGGSHRSGLMRIVTDARAQSASFDYSPYGMTLEAINRDGHLREMDYDQRDNLISSSDAQGDTATFAYDANDNLMVERAPEGHSGTPLGSGSFETRYAYDDMDRATTVTTPTETESLRAEATMDYFPDGTLAAERAATGSGFAVTDYTYHPNQMLRSLTGDAGSGDRATTDYLYDAAGRSKKTTFPANSSGVRPVEVLSYTPASEVWRYETTASTDDQNQQSRTTTLSFSAHGETIEVRGPRSVAGKTQHQEQSYDNFGQLERRRQLLDDPGAPGGERWLSHTYDYDLAGNLEGLTQPNANQASLTTTYDYDVLNRLVEQTDAFDDRHVTRFSYSDEGLQEGRTEIRRESGADTTLRTITSAYNDDDTLRSRIAVEDNSYLALCNYDAGSPANSGYDDNGNLLYSRTLKGTGSGGCGSVAPVSSKQFTYGNRDLATTIVQTVDDPTTVDSGLGAADDTTRRQELAYRRDGLLERSTWNAGTPDDKVTDYSHSQGGLLEGVTDWRDRTSSFDYAPAGNLTETRLGGDVAEGALGYHSDGSLQSLRWTDSLGVPVRSHTGIEYDIGGLKTDETIDVLPAGDMTDTGGAASFDYDLLGRLTGWHNPFGETPIGGEPTHAYSLDDAGNITTEEVTGGDEDVTITQSYSQGRLTERSAQLDAGVATLTVDQYSVMGEEKQRTTTLTPTGGPSTSETLATDHDAQGHTASMTYSPSGGKPRVDFVYDANDRLMARTSDGGTKLFFYFADTGRVAEETSATGTTKSLYLSDSAGRAIAEVKDDNWTWLLRDAEGSVATRLSDNGTVKSHSAYDPYGASNDAGSGIAVGERDPETELGYQSESADTVTGNILVGPRQFDPTTQRFTTADVFIDAGSDLSLATDPLTGNRYLFAAANPVALDDDGHGPCVSDCNRAYSGTKKQQRERERQRREEAARNKGAEMAMEASTPGTTGEPPTTIEAYCDQAWGAAQQEQAARGRALDAWPDAYPSACHGDNPGGGELAFSFDTLEVGSTWRSCVQLAGGAPATGVTIGLAGGPWSAGAGFAGGMKVWITSPAWCWAPAVIRGTEVTQE